MWGFQANKMQRKVSKAHLRGFGFTFFRQGTCTYAIGDSLLRDWGFAKARLGICKTVIGDTQNRDWGFTEKASPRQIVNEGSADFKRGLGGLVKTKDNFSKFPKESRINQRIDSLLPPSILQNDSKRMDFCSYFLIEFRYFANNRYFCIVFDRKHAKLHHQCQRTAN